MRTPESAVLPPLNLDEGINLSALNSLSLSDIITFPLTTLTLVTLGTDRPLALRAGLGLLWIVLNPTPFALDYLSRAASNIYFACHLF